MDQKVQFISDYLRGGLAFAGLCDHFGISCKTEYKWLDRHVRQGAEALVDRSRRPRSLPNHTPPTVINALPEIRHIMSKMNVSDLNLTRGSLNTLIAHRADSRDFEISSLASDLIVRSRFFAATSTTPPRRRAL